MERALEETLVLLLITILCASILMSANLIKIFPVQAQSTVDWWPMFHHDITHTGYSSSPGPGPMQTLWSYATGSYVSASPSVVDGVVYVGSNDHKVYALDAVTGAKIWSFTTNNTVSFSSAAVANGLVYVGSFDGSLYALNSITGARVWSYATGGALESSPAVANGLVYVGSQDHTVYALDAGTGVEIWNYTTGSLVDSAPAVSGGKVYVGSLDDNVYALDAATGVKVWSYLTGNTVESSPAVANGVIYVGSADGEVYAFGPGPLASFAVDASTVYPIAHQSFNATVTAEDAFYNVVTGYNGTVHFSSSDSLAVLPADYTFTDLDNGVHTFPITFNTAGSQDLKVSDLASSVSNTPAWNVGGLTIVNTIDMPPSSDWNYVISVIQSPRVAPGTVIENFTLPAGGGNVTFSDYNFTDGGLFNIVATPKFGYSMTISTQIYDDYSTSTVGDFNATLYLAGNTSMTVTFANAFMGAFSTQSLGSSPPSGVNFTIPANQPFPIQAAWNVTLKNDGRIDLVVNKTMAVLVNFTQTMQLGQAVNVTVTFNGTTYGQVVQESVLAQNNLIVFEPIVPKYNGTMTITGTYQIGTSANPSSLTGNPTSLTSTAVTVKDTIILPLYFYSLTNSNYGSVNSTDVAQMVGNTTAFINATYPVKNIAVSPSTPIITGNASSNSPSKFQGIINDCLSVSVQAAKSSYGKVTRGIGIGPNNGPGQQDYFTYHGAPGGAGFTVNPNCHGVIVLDGYYTVAAHEVGHTFGLYWPPTSEEYVKYPPNGKPTSGIWPEQNQWRTGYDIMGTAPYRTLNLTWIDSKTYAQIFSITKATGNDPELLIVSGLIYKNGTIVLPQTWYQLQSGVPDTIVPGNYSLQFYYANGTLISTTSFDAPFSVQIDPGVTVGQNTPDLSNFGTVETDVTGFAFTIPYPQGTARVNIVNNTDPNNPITMTTVSAANIVYVPPSTVNITFTTSGIGSDANSATVLTIDKIPYSYSQLQSLSFGWIPGSNHTITVANPVAATSGKQYAFINWTNGNGLQSGTSNYTVPNTDTVVTANFKTQFRLTVTTNPIDLAPQPWIKPSGIGTSGAWYDANTNVTLIASPLAIKSLSNWYIFNYWILDGKSQNTCTLMLKIKMDQAHTAIANYAQLRSKFTWSDSHN